ncbi:cell wall-binding repeat-containing protein [Catenulispora sp. GAS73]|uniref:cell wall-binding repeat-containing protein n=1 Tax=Catenulispora sp. GAS73 TaxID=3156269 RepID=UPI00351282D4
MTGGGVSALTTAAHAATAGSSSGSTGSAANGPIAYNDGTHWSEVNADGSGQQTITPSGGGFNATDGIRDVAFSPDGSWAAFMDTKTVTLWVSWADGTHARQITTTPAPDSPAAATGEMEPVWSPDSKTIVFQLAAGLDGGVELWSVPSDGSAQPTRLVPASGGCYAGDASFAPNGDLAYSEICVGPNNAWSASVKVIDATTKTVKHTIPGFRRPRFSPDGTKLTAFTASADTPSGFAYRMAPDGSDALEFKPGVVSGCADGSDLAWSPDGSQVAHTVCPNPSIGLSQAYVQVQSSTQDWVGGKVKPVSGQNPQPFITWAPPFTPPTTQNPGRPDPTSPPSPGRPYTLRLGGGDRVATAIAVADHAYGPAATAKAKVAVLSRSDNYADALAGNALAAQKGGPLLLTGGAKLDPSVGAELGKLLPKGSTVYVLGGDQALSPQVEAGIRALGLTPKRLAGADRFETATKIAAEVSPHPHTVLVATGVNAPDALAAGAAAATDPNGGVVLLSDDKVLPAATKAYLAHVNPAATAVYGVGVQGVAALNTEPGFAGRFTKLAGADRYATDAAVANNATLYPNPAQAALATGWTWPDALSGGAYAGALHAPLLLTDGGVVPAGAARWLHAHGSALTFVPVFGGPNAVPDGAVKQAGGQAWGAGNFDTK